MIDDEGSKGWDKVMEKIFQNQGYEITMNIVENEYDAKEEIEKNEFDLIFLDMRLHEKDYVETLPKKFSSFLVLEKIRCVESKNFTTPVILFTASNKIWNINTFLKAGADDYYVKENPIFSQDPTFAKENYERLLKGIERLLQLSKKRRIVWSLIQGIKEQSEERIINDNIKERIYDKLKIGYGILFRKRTDFENKVFLFNQEIVSFMIFWSILDEIAHDFLVMDSSKDPISATIEIRNVSRFYQKEEINNDNNNNEGVISRFNIRHSKYDPILFDLKYRRKQLELSTKLKINAILHFKNEWNFPKIEQRFNSKLNNYRNNIDFIHPSLQASLNGDIKTNIDSQEAFNKCDQLLRFILDDLLK